MPVRRRVSGRFDLPIPAMEAIDLFTPEGERSWVPGWDPTYPAGDVSENSGTVFLTHHGDASTIWVIERIDRMTNRATYARITPGHHAGTVSVECLDSGDGECEIHVTYDMTLLPEGDPTDLDPYEGPSFEAMMGHWQESIRRDL